MARFYGVIGFYFDEEEIRPGIWDKIIEERTVYGDLIRNIKRTENTNQSNDNININNQVSFLADSYAMDNFHHIKYVKYFGGKWAVTSVEVAYPRLILNLGGVYND